MLFSLFTCLISCSETEKEPDPASESEVEDEAVEVCDGIDNDGDGLIDEQLYYVTWNNKAGEGIDYRGGEVQASRAVGVRYLESWQDGYRDTTIDETTGEEITTIVSNDGEGDHYLVSYMDENGNLLQSEADRDGDGFPEDLIRYKRDGTAEKNITESLWFQESALHQFNEYSWTNNTPSQEYKISSQYTYGIGMEPIWEIEHTWTSTSHSYEARNYITEAETSQSFYFLTADDEYEDGLHTSRLRTIYLEEYFGNPQGEGTVYLQRYFEYRYNEDRMIEEREMWLTQDQLGTYPLDTSVPGVRTQFSYDEQGDLVHYNRSSVEGVMEEFFLARENRLPVQYALDSDGDGSIDYETNMQYDGNRIIQVNRTVHNPEVYTESVFAQSRYIYDENHNLIRSEIDADGDGTTDITIDYVISCEETAHSFDAEDYDYGN